MNHLQKKYLLVCIVFLSFQHSLIAQDKVPIKFGKVTLQDFDVQSPLIDSNTNAVIVANVGSSEFIANTTEVTFSLLYKEKKRIKIINKNGFDAATITIPLYVANNNPEKLYDLDAYTYNIENGKVVSAKIDKASIFTEKKNDHWIYKKFTFPALKEGCIIEYSYEIKSDYFFNLHDWTFQDEYPTLWSQYEAAIPEFYKFIELSQGYHQLTKKTDQSMRSYSFMARSTNNDGRSTKEDFSIEGMVDYNTWTMKDIPAIKEEAYTTTIRNAIAKVEFQLKQVAYPRTIPRNVMSDWEKVSKDMMEDEKFGALINRPNNWLDDDVSAIVKGVSAEGEKTRKIYEYIRDNFTCTDYNRYMVSTSLKDVMKNKSGSVADINMLLIAMLRTQKIAADPVLLSTRNHGYANELYPLMDKYNYVIAQVSSNNNLYYLDAATPRLGFNKLSPKVYNGQARAITKETALPVYFLPDSLTEASFSNVFIENNDKGGVAGFSTSTMGYFQSLSVRDKVAKSGMEAYQKELKELYPEDVEATNFTIDSLKTLEEPVTVKCNLALTAFGDADVVYVNPMLGEVVKKNPFTAAERFYPVELPFTVNDVYSFNMDIPKGYKVDEVPKSVRLMLNEDEGMFEYLVSSTATAVQMRCRLLIKKAFFPNEDYQTLRDFYTYVVKKEAEQIVFKKIK
jgi:transglutaminase-like putative cysteine protease